MASAEEKRNGTYQFIIRGNTIIKILYSLFTVNKVIREKRLDIDKNDKSNKIASLSIGQFIFNNCTTK